MHNLQKPIVGTLVQGLTQNPCLAAGLIRSPKHHTVTPVVYAGSKLCLSLDMCTALRIRRAATENVALTSLMKYTHAYII